MTDAIDAFMGKSHELMTAIDDFVEKYLEPAAREADRNERIVALARQLCDFVEYIAATEDGASCRMSLAEAHRARVVANNLRPLLDQHEKQVTA
jgi:hypothetical protein